MGYKSGTNTPASHSLVLERPVNVMTEPEESPTHYMLPEQNEEGAVDCSLKDHSPARYPTFNKKRKKAHKKKNKSKKAKKEPGKSVQFHPTVTLKTIYRSLKNRRN